MAPFYPTGRVRNLKTWPRPFQELADEIKSYEVRKDDRTPPYAVGDTVNLLEFDPDTETYTGRVLRGVICHKTGSQAPSPLPDGLCVLGLRHTHPVVIEQLIGEATVPSVPRLDAPLMDVV